MKIMKGENIHPRGVITGELDEYQNTTPPKKHFN